MSDPLPPQVSVPPPFPDPPQLSPISRPIAAQSRRAISGLLILGLVLLGGLGVGLVLTFFFSLGSLGSSGGFSHTRAGRSHLYEVVLEDNDAEEKVAVVNISGVISGGSLGFRGNMVEGFRDQLDRAAEDEHVKAVVLRVDSPGGEVLASDEIYRAIRTFQTTNGKPVIASMGSLAASGGYYVSAPCRWIVAHPLTLTGSIGVIFHGYNYRGLMDKVGVLPDIVKSGKLKDMFSGEQRPEDVLPEEKTILKDLVKESFDRFKQVIREGRGWAAEQNKGNKSSGQKLAADWEEIADGRILSGNQALKAGLVDELGDFNQAVKKAMEFSGLKSANLITYQAPKSVADLIGLFGQAPSGKVLIELPGFLPGSGLPQGRMYFISPLHLR
ncbi:MAG TPA: signal peptide peptidase SppA [Verrucomicrobiales bacterium]|nr:signal peptide peptidase SppA [Verrucomicrobiales bacterium]